MTISELAKMAKMMGGDNGGNGAKPEGLEEWNAGLDVTPPPPRGWLLGNAFCRRFISSLIADGGVGKTALRILQALSLATGRSLTGEHVFQRSRVLVVSLEDDADELKRRVLAARLHFGIEPSELDGWLFLATPGAAGGKLKTTNPRGQVVDGQLKANLEAAITTHGIDLIVIDPFVKSHGVAENDNNALDEVAQLLSDLAAAHDIAIDVPHHVSKGPPEPGNAQRGRGASALVDAGRLCYTLTPMSEDEAKAFGVPDEQRRQYVRLDRAKVNLVRAGGPAKWLRLVGVRLENGNDLYPNGDDVQTVEPWKPPSAWSDLDEKLLNEILNAIQRGVGDGNFYTARPHAGRRDVVPVVRRYARQKTVAQAREIVRTWIRNGVLVEFEYQNPGTRKPAIGLKVEFSARPGESPPLEEL